MALPPTRHPERVAVIRRHRLDTVAYLLASDGDCLGVTQQIVERVTGRNLVLTDVESLLHHPLPESWALAVLLCPGDDTAGLAEWARGVSESDREQRIWFYESPGIDAARAYAPWLRAGHGSEILRDTFDGWKDFNRLFGNDLNQRIWLDFRDQ